MPVQLVILETTDVWKMDAPLRHVKPQVAKLALVSVILWNMVRLACLTQECDFLHFVSAMMFDTVDGRNHVWTKVNQLKPYIYILVFEHIYICLYIYTG